MASSLPGPANSDRELRRRRRVTRFPSNEGIKLGYPLGNRSFATINSFSVKTVADLLLIITSTADGLSGGTNVVTSMTMNDLEPQNRGFSDFFCNFRLQHTFQK